MRPTLFCLITILVSSLVLAFFSSEVQGQYQYQNSANNGAAGVGQGNADQRYAVRLDNRRAVTPEQYIESTSPLRGGRGQVTSRSVPGSKVQTVTMIASLPVSDQLRSSPAQPRDDRFARADFGRDGAGASSVGSSVMQQNDRPFQLASSARMAGTANLASNVAQSDRNALTGWGSSASANQQRSLRPAQSGVGFASNNPVARVAQNNCNCVPAYQYQSQYQVPAATAPALPQLQTPQVNAPQFQLQTPQMQLPQLTGGQQQLQFLQPPNVGSGGGGLGLFNSNNSGAFAGNGAAPGGGGFGFANPNGYQWNGGGTTGRGLFSGIGQTGPAQRLSNWWRPLWSGRGAYVPIIKLANLSPGVYLGQGIIGQPTAYVDGQPVRNLLRYIAP